MTATFPGWPPRPDWAALAHHRKGCFSLRPVMPGRDAALLQQWFCSQRARFWSMPDNSLIGVCRYYGAMQRSGHAYAFLGHAHGRPAFVIECYDPSCDRLAAHYPVIAGDLGLHLFVAPPEVRVPRFTHDAFRFVLGFMFGPLGAARIVVEPDIANTRIHALNRSMGFCEAGRIVLPDKTATLAFCTRDDFLTHHPLEFP